MPGKPGTKEAFGISKIHDNETIIVPPRAIEHYSISDCDLVILMTGRRGKRGFGMVKKETALRSIFKKFVNRIKRNGEIYWSNDRAFGMYQIENGQIQMNSDALNAFHIHCGDRLIVVKSTTVTISFTPVEVWIAIFKKHGFHEAINNIEKLEEF